MAKHTHTHWSLYVLLVLVLLLIGGCVYLYLQLTDLEKQYSARDNQLTDANTQIADLETELKNTQDVLADEQNKNEDLSDDLHTEKDRNDEFQDQINDLTDTVGDLDKLSKTDKELLKKYSKVYFLNENYIPESLSEIDDEWKYTESKDLKLHSKVMPFFEDMVEDAKDDGVNLWVVSAYRSWGEQANLKSAYSVTYGAGANAFSADQGYSEHQLGTTIDFTTNGLGGGLDGFQYTDAYQWLLKNAHKYGFVLSYPEGNSYYVFEPWHWRFVGEDLADDLHDKDAHFYDWGQREIDDYLLHIFD